MTRFTIALTLVALGGSWSLAQEAADQGRESREVEQREDRSASRARREYARKKVSVKDPDGYKADGERVFSGPQSGEKLASFLAASLAGESKGKEVDPIAVGGGNPHVLFFQDDSGVSLRGLFGLLDAIAKIDQKTDKDLQVACVFLTDDPDTLTNRFARAFPTMQKRGLDVIAVSKDGRNGPGAYGLNRNVSQTIILAKDGKVTRNFVFRQGLLYADPHVMGGIAELVDEDVETVAGWLANSNEEEPRMQMSRENDAQAKARAAFGEKLSEFVREGKLTRQEAAELHRAAFSEQR